MDIGILFLIFLVCLFLPWGRKQIFILFFTEQLITVTEENLPLVPSLKMIASDTKQIRFRRLIQAVARDMEEGHSFYESLSRRRGVFPQLYLKMVDIGERNGNLSQMLRHFHDHFQRMAKFKGEIVELLYLPGTSFIVMLGMLLVTIRFVLPTFREMFADTEIELPVSTSYLMAAGNWLTINGYLLFLGLVVLLFVLGIIHLLANKTSLVRLLLDRLYISLPVIGPLTKEMDLMRFSHTLGTLLENGVPLDEALETTGEVPMNSLLQRETKKMAGGVREGERLSHLLQRRRFFPLTFTWITSVGEGRGTLEKSLFQAGDFYHLRFEAALMRITAMSVPIAILIQGCLVALIAIGTFAGLVAITDSLI